MLSYENIKRLCDVACKGVEVSKKYKHSRNKNKVLKYIEEKGSIIHINRQYIFNDIDLSEELSIDYKELKNILKILAYEEDIIYDETPDGFDFIRLNR